MKPKVSIITPVYRAEKFLHRCVESIKAQTLSDWELLIVDDGSPDNSGKLCDDYSAQDSRIKVFHKTNGGVASARELGVQNATGEYSLHIDPDDWIDAKTLQTVYESAVNNEADMVIFDLMMEYGKKSEVYSQRADELSAHGFFIQLANQDLHGSLCCKLIRTDLYQRFNLHFPKGMNCWEDLYISCSMLLHEIKVVYLPEAFYHYDRFSAGESMTRHTDLNGLNSQMECIRLLKEQLPEERWSELDGSKETTLETAFGHQLLSEVEIRSLYPEINDQYLTKYRNCWELTRFYGLCCVLKGNSYRMAHLKMWLTYMTVRLFKIFGRIYERQKERRF